MRKRHDQSRGRSRSRSRSRKARYGLSVRQALTKLVSNVGIGLYFAKVTDDGPFFVTGFVPQVC